MCGGMFDGWGIYECLIVYLQRVDPGLVDDPGDWVDSVPDLPV